jgi:DNA primase large subunit
MATAEQTRNKKSNNEDNPTGGDGRSDNLRDSAMMAHLLDALEEGKDIGHYGRLTFTMIARHFLEEDELVRLLSNQPEQDETKARALVLQVQGRDYNPPKRDRILEWQSQQDFPICPTPDDPNSCNVYSELRFPENIYESINEFYEEQAQANDQ